MNKADFEKQKADLLASEILSLIEDSDFIKKDSDEDAFVVASALCDVLGSLAQYFELEYEVIVLILTAAYMKYKSAPLTDEEAA